MRIHRITLVISSKLTSLSKTNVIKKLAYFVFIYLSTYNLSMALEDPWKVLSDAHFAAKTQNYQGIYRYTHNSETRSVDITHALHGSDEYTRMTLMDGTPGEVLSHGKNTTVYHSSEKNIHIKRRDSSNLFPAVIPDDIENLKNVYNLHFGKADRIADRAAQIVVLIPKDKYRYRYHFWLDKKTSIPLKMLVSDEQNKLVEEAAFVNVNFVDAHNDLSWFAPKIDLTKDYLMNEGSIDLPSQKFWKFSDLPDGFKKISAKATRNNGITMLSHHLVFSDGLSYLSVFLQPVQRDHKPKVGSIKMGSTNVCAKFTNGYQVMTVGAVPKKTCEMFTESISF